jgi:hypothetical protein
LLAVALAKAKQITPTDRVSFSNFISGKCQNTLGRYIFYYV